MHRKQFSCFSIESLIGQQSRRAQLADGGDSSAEEQRSVVGQWSTADRTWTAYGSRVDDDGELSTDRDARRQRNSPGTLLNGRPTTTWNRRLPTVVANKFLPTNDQWTSHSNASDRHLRHGIRVEIKNLVGLNKLIRTQTVVN